MIKCKSRCGNNIYRCCKDCENYNGKIECAIGHVVCFKASNLSIESIPIKCEQAKWINEEEESNE